MDEKKCFYIVKKLNRRIISRHRTARTAEAAEARLHAHYRRVYGSEQWVPTGVYEARVGFDVGLIVDESQFKRDFRQIVVVE